MIKRFTAIVLAFIYLSVSTGFTMNVHHCMGLLTSISIAGHSDCVCKVLGADLCCKTTFIRVELKDQSQKTSIDASVVFSIILLSISRSNFLAGIQPVPIQFSYLTEGPPGYASLPDYILFQNLRI